MEREELREAINAYLRRPDADASARRSFVEREITYLDGSAGHRTADYLLSLLPREVAAGPDERS